LRWPPVVATAAGRGRCRCHRPPPARHPHTVPHVHGTLHAVALPLAVLPKTVIQRLFHVHVGCANCVEPCARDTASDLKRIQNLRWSIGCTASQVGPSGTAHVSSELVKAHIPRRGRPSCRNNAYSRCGHAFLTVACVLPLAGFPEMATSIAGGASTSRQCNPKMPGASSFPRPAATVSQARWRDGNNFRGGATDQTCPERTKDGCCHYHFKTSFKPGRKCRRRRGLGRSSKDLNRRSCPDYPARRGD
jgi:hypothetical protein